jgi:opine dehydrogenase
VTKLEGNYNMKKVAVLGAGSTGHAIAADLTIAGFQVTLYEHPDFKEKIEGALFRGGIEIKGATRKGFVKIHKITLDIKEALEDVDLIIVATWATRHEEIAELCLPHLKNGQVIAISPGNAGSLVFAKKLNDDPSRKVTIVDIEGNLYACRLVAPATVFVGLPTSPKYVAAFPAQDTQSAINAFAGIYEFLPAKNLLEVALNVPNITHHLAASLLNTGSIEKSGGEYYLYRQGLTPSIIRCIKAIVYEKAAILKALGYNDRYNIGFIEQAASETEFPELAEFRALIGPTSMQHRYIIEDAAIGVSLLVSLGELLHIPTPATKAIITLASIINQTDYLQQGRTIDKLGLADFNVDQLNYYLTHGKREDKCSTNQDQL